MHGQAQVLPGVRRDYPQENPQSLGTDGWSTGRLMGVFAGGSLSCQGDNELIFLHHSPSSHWHFW